MDKSFTVVRRSDVVMEFEGGADKGSVLAKSVDDTKSDVMGAGYFRVNADPNRLDLPYDEVAFCLEGTLKLTVDGVEHKLGVGDFAFIPKGTDVVFDGDDCVCGYAVQPVDWRTKS